jgi:hypothetical protein
MLDEMFHFHELRLLVLELLHHTEKILLKTLFQRFENILQLFLDEHLVVILILTKLL